MSSRTDLVTFEKETSTITLLYGKVNCDNGEIRDLSTFTQSPVAKNRICTKD